MEIKVKKLCNNAIVPTRGSNNAAGYDLYACINEPIFSDPHETVMIGTGLSIELPDGTFGAVFARSGISVKRGLAPANKVGCCDSDYRGEYKVALHNHSNTTQWVSPNERIAQLVILPYIVAEFVETDSLTETERGVGGFGSTGEH